MTARRWLLIAVAALAAVWLLAPSITPIYDGLGNPDEPYRYVVRPAGDSRVTKPPTSATATLRVEHGTNTAGYANSAEVGPQISLYVPAGALRAPAVATTITVRATPLAPTAPLPANGAIVSDVYHVTAVWIGHGGRGLAIVGGHGDTSPVLQLRAPTAAQPGPDMEHRAGAGWQPEPTLRIGNDIYQGALPATGDWALVRRSTSGARTSGGGINGGLLALGIVLLAVVALLATIRWRRTRSHHRNVS